MSNKSMIEERIINNLDSDSRRYCIPNEQENNQIWGSSNYQPLEPNLLSPNFISEVDTSQNAILQTINVNIRSDSDKISNLIFIVNFPGIRVASEIHRIRPNRNFLYYLLGTCVIKYLNQTFTLDPENRYLYYLLNSEKHEEYERDVDFEWTEYGQILHLGQRRLTDINFWNIFEQNNIHNYLDPQLNITYSFNIRWSDILEVQCKQRGVWYTMRKDTKRDVDFLGILNAMGNITIQTYACQKKMLQKEKQVIAKLHRPKFCFKILRQIGKSNTPIHKDGQTRISLLSPNPVERIFWYASRLKKHEFNSFQYDDIIENTILSCGNNDEIFNLPSLITGKRIYGEMLAGKDIVGVHTYSIGTESTRGPSSTFPMTQQMDVNLLVSLKKDEDDRYYIKDSDNNEEASSSKELSVISKDDYQNYEVYVYGVVNAYV